MAIRGPGPQNGQNTNGTNNLCRDAAWVFWRKQPKNEAAMMWIYDKERLGMHRKHILKTSLWTYNGGASVENIQNITKTTGKTGILKVIEDSRLELWEFWTRRNGYFDPSHGGVKPAGSQARLAPWMECGRDSLCLTGISWYKKPGKVILG